MERGGNKPKLWHCLSAEKLWICKQRTAEFSKLNVISYLWDFFLPNYTHTRRLIQHMDLRKTFAAAKEKGILTPPAPPPSCCYVNPEEIRRRNSTMTAAGIDQMARTGGKKKT